MQNIEIPKIEDVKKYWENLARYYFGLGMNVISVEMTMLSMLKIEQFNNILEVGCGPSFLLPELVNRKKKGSLLHICDLSSKMVSLSIQRIEKYSENAYTNLFVPEEYDFASERND
jgi:ubiquinone/menaquinone biosynthesis C-methylase UbiE